MDLNEEIIECVRKHACLYDLSDKQYKNSVLKARLWQSIAEELNETSDKIKKRWKNIRDGYMKYKKQVKGTTGSEKKTINFALAAQLSFLDCSLSPRKTTSNVSEDSRIQTFYNSDTSSLSPGIATTSTNSEHSVPCIATSAPGTSSYPVNPVPTSLSTPFNQPSEPTATHRRTNKRIAVADVDGMIVNYLNIKKDKHSHDSIDYLFLSYAETFKKFSHRKQATLKVDLAKLFSEAELSEMTSTEHINTAYSPAYSAVSSITENVHPNNTTNPDYTRDIYASNTTIVYSDNTRNVTDSNTNVYTDNTTIDYPDNIANDYPENIPNDYRDNITNDYPDNTQ